MKQHERVMAAIIVISMLLTACSSGSSGDAEVVEAVPTPDIPVVGETATAAPTATAEPAQPETTTTDEPTEVPALDDQAMIDAAMAVFEFEDLPQNRTAPGEVLDLGLISSEISGGVVTLRACPWFDWGVTQAEFEGFYRVSDDAEPVVTQEAIRTVGSCTNEAMLQSAAEFVIGYHVFEAEWWGPDGDPSDPVAAQWYNPGELPEFRETRQSFKDSDRALLYSTRTDGVATAWAEAEGSVDLVIAVRWPHDDRYGWYNVATDQRLAQFSPLRVPVDLQGDQQVLLAAVRWDGQRWGVLTVQDLYGVECPQPDCVDLLNSFGTPDGRGLNRLVPFHELVYQSLPTAVAVP